MNCALRRRCPEEMPAGNYEEKQAADLKALIGFYDGIVVEKLQHILPATSSPPPLLPQSAHLHEMIARRHREMEAEAETARRIARVCTTPQLKKENETLVGRRRQWKPKLDTVYEKKGRRPRKILRKMKSNVV
ncbi:hypothetical protein SASPL_102138 [Salvia splendens]|uniref:Uncharacterized protein n=1 Tax=Salvia splendens TaxID=180675 RepID=A0A8X8YRA7_SALSN|nr:hypothetical protein SASPL_102138 [Salvia splendens]